MVMREAVMSLVDKFYRNCTKLEPSLYVTYKGDTSFLIRNAVGKIVEFKGNKYPIKLDQFSITDIKMISILTGKEDAIIKSKLDGTFMDYLQLYKEVYISVVNRVVVNPLTYKIDGYDNFIIGFNQEFYLGDKKLTLCYNTDVLLIGKLNSLDQKFNPTINFLSKIKYNATGIPVGNPYGFDKALESGEIPERAGNTALSVLLNNSTDGIGLNLEDPVPYNITKTLDNSVNTLTTKSPEMLREETEPLLYIEDFINNRDIDLSNKDYILKIGKDVFIIKSSVFMWSKEINDIELLNLRLYIEKNKIKSVSLEEGNKIILERLEDK